jgi:hypothetical protein
MAAIDLLGEAVGDLRKLMFLRRGEEVTQVFMQRRLIVRAGSGK